MNNMDYKITIWHNLEDENSANKLCDNLLNINIPHLTVDWIHNIFHSGKSICKGLFFLDIHLSTGVSLDDICMALMEKYSNSFIYIELESAYPSSWKKRFEEAEKIKKSGRFVEVTRDKSVSRALPFSDNMILLANHNNLIKGGILVEAKYCENNYHDIEANLVNLGFHQISIHSIHKDSYKIDFNADIIKGRSLISCGWYRDELRTWRHPIFHTKIVFPHGYNLQRDLKWYENEKEWRIVETKPDTFFDYSNDDLSLNPVFW